MDHDALNAAYRRGQEDMRRRAGDLRRGWYAGQFAAAVAETDRHDRAAKHSKVDVMIRALKLRDLPAPPSPGRAP